jgi:hypothetical protein
MDTTIHFLSNHPLEQKLAACRFFIRRMLSLLLDPEQQQEEWQYILHVAQSNGVPLNLLFRLKQKIQWNATPPKFPTH